MELVMIQLEEQFKSEEMISENHLIDLIKYSLELHVRESFTLHQLEVIISIAQYYIQSVCTLYNEEHIKRLTLTLKLLRNASAGIINNQLCIGSKVFIEDIKKLLTWSLSGDYKSESSISLLVACTVQLIGNVCVANSDTQELIWNECYPSVFCSLLSQANENISNICSMVLFNCIRACPVRIQQLITDGDNNIIVMLLRSLRTSQECTEWLVLSLECLLENVSLSVLCILLSPQGEKITLLEYILAYSTGTSLSTEAAKPESFFQSVFTNHSNLLYLIDHYKQMIAKLLRGGTGDENVLTCLHEPSLTDDNSDMIKCFVTILSLLCQCSSTSSTLLIEIQSDVSLLQSSLDLLTALSKLDGSYDSTKNRSHVTSDTVVTDRLYGVKRDLVRMIGNLCYECPINQDIVHDFIPLLLNQCNIDHSNPYIREWGIWAIRNICHNNSTNQDVVRQLELREGKAYNLKELEEKFDCTVEIGHDGKLRLQKKNKN